VLLVATFAVGLVLLHLGGSDLSRLNHLRLRWWPIAIAAVVIQTAIISAWPTGWRAGHLAANLATYAALGVFLWKNRRIPFLWVVALGTAANTAAIAANGGVMPASLRAISISGVSIPHGFANSAAVAHPRVPFLGDVFPTPSWLPLHNVASIGDFLILAGALLVVARQTGRAPTRPPVGTGLVDPGQVGRRQVDVDSARPRSRH
jgi:hypothetical protein